MTYVVLLVAAIGSATISGFIGMAGGVTLLAVMTFILPFHVIVPVHGAVQLASNLSRTLILIKSVRKPVFTAFLIGSPLGAVLAFFFLREAQRSSWLLAFLIFVLFYMALKPKKMPDIKLPDKVYGILGFFATFLGPLMGATGPVLAPFFARDDYTKEEIVATKAACQIVIHLLKLPVFLALAFPYQDYLPMILLMVGGVIVGTKLGTLILHKVSGEQFMIALKVVLFLTGVRLCFKVVGGS